MSHPGTIHKGEVVFVKMIADPSTMVSLQLLVQDASEEESTVFLNIYNICQPLQTQFER